MTIEHDTSEVSDRSESFRSELEKYTAKKYVEALSVGGLSPAPQAKNYAAMLNGLTIAAKAIASQIEAVISPSITRTYGVVPSAYIVNFARINVTEKSESANEMLSYLSLSNGWDGPSSVAPSKKAIGDAFAFVQRLPINNEIPEPTVYADGEVGWYWTKGEDVVSIVFDGDGRYAYFGTVNGKSVRSPRKQYGDMIPQELYSALGQI